MSFWSNQTLALIKPDAMTAGYFIPILTIMQDNFQIADVSVAHWSRRLSAEFYEEHRDRPFYESLVEFTSSGPIAAIVLRGDDVVARWRKMIGPTNPADARATHPDTIRAMFGSTSGPIMHNAVHGSDSEESAKREIYTVCDGISKLDGSKFGKLSLWFRRNGR
jgi:nucleoside-diphosphate kinase